MTMRHDSYIPLSNIHKSILRYTDTDSPSETGIQRVVKIPWKTLLNFIRYEFRENIYYCLHLNWNSLWHCRLYVRYCIRLLVGSLRCRVPSIAETALIESKKYKELWYIFSKKIIRETDFQNLRPRILYYFTQWIIKNSENILNEFI